MILEAGGEQAIDEVGRLVEARQRPDVRDPVERREQREDLRQAAIERRRDPPARRSRRSGSRTARGRSGRREAQPSPRSAHLAAEQAVRHAPRATRASGSSRGSMLAAGGRCRGASHHAAHDSRENRIETAAAYRWPAVRVPARTQPEDPQPMRRLDSASPARRWPRSRLAACGASHDRRPPHGGGASARRRPRGGGGGGAACATAAAGATAAVTVEIKDFKFSPQPVRRRSATSSAGRTATARRTPRRWTTARATPTTIAGGATGLLVFNEAGTYTYHCNVHPAQMKGLHGPVS